MECVTPWGMMAVGPAEKGWRRAGRGCSRKGGRMMQTFLEVTAAVDSKQEARGAQPRRKGKPLPLKPGGLRGSVQSLCNYLGVPSFLSFSFFFPVSG